MTNSSKTDKKLAWDLLSLEFKFNHRFDSRTNLSNFGSAVEPTHRYKK